MCRRVNFPILIVSASVLCLVWSTASLAEVPKAVGFWRFEGNTSDSGSGGNNGTLKGTAAIVTDAQRGKCLKLDGDGYMDIPSGVTELGDASFTITAWIKTTSNGAPILSKSNGNTEWEEREKELYVADSEISEGNNDGTIEYVGHSCEWVRGDTAIDDGQWHHIALAWDADEEDGCFYVDGVEDTGDVGFSGGADNDGDTVRIGFSESAHSSGNFTGLIDDVAIFDAALTAEQVVELRKLSGGDKIKVIKPTAQKDMPITLDTESHLVGWFPEKPLQIHPGMVVRARSREIYHLIMPQSPVEQAKH